MCCLFGLFDYGEVLSRRDRERIIRVLSVESQQRGTDATGIAYLKNGSLTICKRPLPASRMWFHFPSDANIVMGHTRMTTQGNEKKNYNNHPFKGACGETTFALAHNGVLHNDWALRRNLNLPTTKIETDSYVAVQLLEKNKALNFTAIRDMAETVEGSFCFSILDSRKRLFLVKGDNPLAVYKNMKPAYSNEPVNKSKIHSNLQKRMTGTIKAYREHPLKDSLWGVSRYSY